MALITCWECGGDISSLAASCPKCGAPVTLPDKEGTGTQNVGDLSKPSEHVRVRWHEESTFVPSFPSASSPPPLFMTCSVIGTDAYIAFLQARAQRDLAGAGFAVGGPLGMLAGGAIDAIRRFSQQKPDQVSIKELHHLADQGKAVVVPRKTVSADARELRRPFMGPHYACVVFRSDDFYYRGASEKGLVISINFGKAKKIADNVERLIGSTVQILTPIAVKDWSIQTLEGKAVDCTGWKGEVSKLIHMARKASRNQ